MAWRTTIFLLSFLAVGCSDAAEPAAPADSPQSQPGVPSEGTDLPEGVTNPETRLLPSGVDRFGECPDQAEGSSQAVFDANSGTYAATIESFDVESLVLSFDVVQWLSGQEAVDAFHEEFPDDSNGPPNDYWVRNENPAMRTASVADDADILLVRLRTDSSADVSGGTLAEFSDYLTRTPLSYYWLTFDTETVVTICEQYTP